MELSDKPSLSISQTAYIVSKDLKYFVDALRYLLLANLVLLSIGWANTVYHFDETFYVLVYIELSIFSIYFSVIFVLKRPYKKLKDWIEKYLDEAYTVVFSTTIPKGSSAGERILELASEIFLQLREDYEYLLLDPLDKLKLAIKGKIIRSGKQHGKKTFNYKVNSESVDLAMETDEGYFIVKDFGDKVVSVEVLKDLINILDRKFRNRMSITSSTDIFRAICVAKSYGHDFLNRESLERLMTEELDANFPVDLIVEEEIGYSVLWVDSNA